MLRWSALVGVVFLVLLASGASAATVSPDDYLGEWTADTTSQPPAASQVFTVAYSDETAARTTTGSNSINFDVYCKSTNSGVQPVTYFTVATTTSGTFGGCVSAKTQGHIYTWNSGQVWYAHTATVKGETVIKGDINTSGNVDHAFTAHHPSVTFLVHVKFSKILKKGTHIAELTTITGAGQLRLEHAPNPCDSADRATVLTGEGALALKIVKVGGPNVVELDSLTVKPIADQTGGATYDCDHRQLIKSLDVSVTKSDPAEKDACPVGATGSLTLHDGGGKKNDVVVVDIPKCHIDDLLSSTRAKKGSHVAVAETLDEKGY